MIELIKKIHHKLTDIINHIVPRSVRIRTDAEAFGITQFMKYASKEVKSSDKVLDAGAGLCPYKKYFSHAKYESTDCGDTFDKSSKNIHNFMCSLDNIPKKDNSYDALINTQVLEHVEYPQKVIKEFYRILKPNGKLFLTAPQGWGIHREPYHFFNFTKYGLKSLFTKAGFHVIFIKPRGGIFWYLGKRIKILPSYIISQYLFEKNSENSTKFRPKLTGFLLFPLYLIAEPFCEFLIPFLFFYLDKLDHKQDFTLGYACYCIKAKVPKSCLHSSK